MRCVSLIPEIGGTAKTYQMNQYPLPAGLPAGLDVDVIGGGPWMFTVRDSAGKEWEVCRQALDAGWLYWLADQWLPPEHPMVLQEKNRPVAPAPVDNSNWKIFRRGKGLLIRGKIHHWTNRLPLIKCHGVHDPEIIRFSVELRALPQPAAEELISSSIEHFESDVPPTIKRVSVTLLSGDVVTIERGKSPPH